MCGAFFGYWELGGGGGEISFVSVVGTMTWGIKSGLSLGFSVHVYKEN